MNVAPARRAWWPMVIGRCAPTTLAVLVTGIVAAARGFGNSFPPLVTGASDSVTTRSGYRRGSRAGARLLGAAPRVCLMFVVAPLMVGTSLTAYQQEKNNAV